jgi:predicted Zn-dependent protease
MAFDRIEQDLRQSPLVSKDVALNTYVQGVVCRLAGANCVNLRIYVVDDPECNASTAANGMVIVNTGLLLRVENEAQFAFVLGHEMTHYLRRHGWKRFETEETTGNVLALLSLGVAAASVRVGVNLNSVNDVASLIATGAYFSYTRDQEREADAGGFELAVANGYDPEQGAVLWHNMDQESTADPDHGSQMLFFATHPTDTERLTTMAALAAEVELKTPAKDLGRDRLKAIVDPHRYAWLEEELNRGHLSQSVELISRLLAAEPNSAELQFFLGEALRRRNGPQDLDHAITAYQAAIADANPPVRAYRGLGIAALKDGQRDIAQNALRKYMELAPAADDRAMMELYLAKAQNS